VKLRTSLTAAGAALVLGTTGALLAPQIASASADHATHTLKLISVTKKMVSFTKTSVGIQDTDVNKAGKVIGFDEIYGVETSPTTSAANVTLDTTGGMLYGTFTINLRTGNISDGKVTGGTGAFKGARGTLKATAINSVKSAVTITYRT
jgi:hypothetical protein